MDDEAKGRTNRAMENFIEQLKEESRPRMTSPSTCDRRSRSPLPRTKHQGDSPDMMQVGMSKGEVASLVAAVAGSLIDDKLLSFKKEILDAMVKAMKVASNNPDAHGPQGASGQVKHESAIPVTHHEALPALDHAASDALTAQDFKYPVDISKAYLSSKFALDQAFKA